jgi:hypothetical protein
MSKTEEIIEKVVALRELTKSTGTRTTRTVNDLLQKLTDAELVEVAVGIKKEEMRHAAMRRTLSGINTKGNENEQPNTARN